jgi:transketolase
MEKNAVKVITKRKISLNRIKELQKKAVERRMDLIRMIYEAKTGHTGGALSSLDILVALHYEIMNIDPKNPAWDERDRFILSKGHSVEGYYTILADRGFFPKEELKTFSRYQSRLIGHPTVKVPGIEMNTGALGHGLSAAVGMALAGKMDEKAYKVYVLMGDGEQAEGSVWEAAMAAAHYGLDNLIGIIDRNRLQISGNTENVMALESLKEKWSAFGWEVLETPGNDIEKLVAVFQKIPVKKAKPHLIIANTVKGKGVSFMENVAKWHHGVPTEEQMAEAMRELEQQLEEVTAT